MPVYRVYRLDGRGRINGGEWIDAPDDAGAHLGARARLGSERYELWDGKRLVGRTGGRPPND